MSEGDSAELERARIAREQFGPNTGDWLAHFIRRHEAHLDGDEVFILEDLVIKLGGELQ